MLRRAATYLDSNAGAPLRPEVVEALLSILNTDSQLGLSGLLPNPSSIHSHGRKAKRLVAEAREKIACSLGASVDPEQLIFTSSGTEANQLAVKACLEPKLLQGGAPHWILTPVEHDSNLQLVQWLRERGGSVDFLPVDEEGRPRISLLPELWKPETALVSAVWVNNETGVITDVAALSSEVKRLGGLLHLDAAQAWGKLPVDLHALGANLVTFSGHKIGALAGSGLLWVGRGVPIRALIAGKQEKGRRGGTENFLGIVAMGAAAETLNPSVWASRVEICRDWIEREARARIPGTWVNGGGAQRVANTLNLNFEGVEGDGLVMALDLAGFSVSSGSACSSGVLEPSHVLLAMGRTRAQAMAAVRVSLADELSEEIREEFVKALEQSVARVRQSKTLH